MTKKNQNKNKLTLDERISNLKKQVMQNAITMRKKIKNGTIIHDGGDIYEVDLKSIWELYFSDMSFGKLKYLFYNSELFEFSETIGISKGRTYL